MNMIKKALRFVHHHLGWFGIACMLPAAALLSVFAIRRGEWVYASFLFLLGLGLSLGHRREELRRARAEELRRDALAVVRKLKGERRALSEASASELKTIYAGLTGLEER